ncbi:sigma-70 family RNA polymerase sigma factor [Bacillus sp. ISL-47]|uniref:sigma-70 family RNA polymerase sigma factor n=1 Tax=Bacillus sp. ISL-47 TaxID=2819130 RepID=UPI001BECE771|nr:sigma-70 family RNA polymerase sigma factor [Bacillus sp. ISL-47]MBT2690569.1 sigma-70 family RNA polymerase sigma factor [Bacillus sp. ISL-47]MBT2710908.1 sigma-70 family RNA polymerase sigma factor [Pseudomonas sp. ISL-84]
MDRHRVIADLMDRYGTEVLHLAYSYVRNRQTAEDLAQEIFIKCYEKLDSFEGNAAIETWLYRVAVNHCKDYLKSWHHRKMLVTGYISSFITAKHSGAERQYFEKWHKSELIEAVFMLPIKYREMIFLYYFKEYSQGEISEILGLNLSTVKARMVRGRELLKNLMTERGGGDGEGFEKDKRSNA